MITKWDNRLEMDFSSMYDDNNHPSDIDLFFMGKTEKGEDILIIGERKWRRKGLIFNGQKRLLEAFANRYKDPCIILHITHTECRQNGDTYIDVGGCKVEEYYYSPIGEWVIPKYYTTVKNVIDKYRR